jgi:hypothetical protein
VAAAAALACAHTAEDAPRLMSEARAEFEEGYTEEALDKMRTVTELVPDDAEAHYLRGALALRTDRHTLAALAEVYRLSGDAEKCTARYEQFVWQFQQRDPKTLDGREQRALDEARLRAQECETAVAALAKPKGR